MDSGAFDAKFFRLTIDAFARSALGVHGFVERAAAIHQEASATSRFIIDLLLASFSFQELFMIAGLSRGLREEQRATVAQSAIAIGMSIVKGGVHAQSDGTKRSAIGFKGGGTTSIERDSCDSPTTSNRVVDVPGIIGGICGDVRGELLKGNDSLLRERPR